MKKISFILLNLGLVFSAFSAEYVIVAQQTVEQNQGAIPVLLKRYETMKPKVLVYQNQVSEVLGELQKERPRYICFMPDAHQAGREFVAAVHQLTRKIDSDPYTDAIWGIIVGGKLPNLAENTPNLEIKNILGNTSLVQDRIPKHNLFSELQPGICWTDKGNLSNQTTELAIELTQRINRNDVDMMVTSAHASERDFQPGFRFRAGRFMMKEGALVAISSDLQRQEMVKSTNAKILLACGNCLMGHFNDPINCMAAGWFKNANVQQMIGYTVPTWFGYMGWGVVDYFVEQPGRFTFAEAFFANQQALLYTLDTNLDDLGNKVNDRKGFQFDRDVVAFYGDPAWSAQMPKGKCNWEQTLSCEGEIYTFIIKPLLGDKTFEPVDTNGSMRGHRPIIEFFPKQILGNIEVISNDLPVVITENFIMAKQPNDKEKVKDSYIIKFKVK